MERIPPSEIIRQELNRALNPGPRLEGCDRAGDVIRLAARLVLQEALESEQGDFIGRGRYEREGEKERHGYRNGYEPGHMDTAEGRIELNLPQVRGANRPYRSRLLEFLGQNTEVLDKLAVEMYARGLSTRDVEEAFTDATGERLLSRSAVSEVTDSLWEEYQAFQERDLSAHQVEYLFVDAVYESLREQGGCSEAVLCSWAICADGRKVLLHLALGNKESYDSWRDFFRSMVSRGLKTPVTVTSDGAPGLMRAIGEAFPHSLRLRCWFHKMQNVVGKLPEVDKEEVRAHLRAIRDAPTLAVGEQIAAAVIARYQAQYPAAMRSLEDDLEASLAVLRLPADHRIYCRTTNLVERSFVEERRRTKIIPHFMGERSCLKLVFGTLIRVSRRWSRIGINDLQRAQLARLRLELTPPAPPPSDTTLRMAS